MKRIAIIGSSGAGKSTLARALSRSLTIKVYHLDRFFWGPGWKGEARDDRIDIVQSLIREKQWIIEGTYLASSQSRLDEADTIIFLDMPAWLCLLRIVRRHYQDRGRPRRDLPIGCTDKLSWRRIWKVLIFPLGELRRLRKMMRGYQEKYIIWLHSPLEVEQFLTQIRYKSEGKQIVPGGTFPRRHSLFSLIPLWAVAKR